MWYKSLTDCKNLFFYLKYKDKDIFEAWPVIVLGLASYKYLFFYLKYEISGVFITISYLSNKYIKHRSLANHKYIFFLPKYNDRHISKI